MVLAVTGKRTEQSLYSSVQFTDSYSEVASFNARSLSHSPSGWLCATVSAVCQRGSHIHPYEITTCRDRKVVSVDKLSQETYLADVSIRCSNVLQGEMKLDGLV